jgi:D-glycero-alpha-D-manno-heptose 1-phosphate guanylyltransferase
MSDAGPRGTVPALPPAVVLVGGRGTRLGTKTAETPKPMIEVAGAPFLHWVTRWLVRQGVGDIVYSAGFCGAQVAAWTERERRALPVGVTLSARIETDPLGTGGAILDCVPDGAEDILALNGDSLLLCDLQALADRHRSTGSDATVALFEVDDASRYGTVIADADGRMMAFGEKRPGAGWVNGGIYMLGPRFRALFPRGRALSMEYDLLPNAIDAGLKVMTFRGNSPFIDIGTPESLAAAGTFVAEHMDRFGSVPVRSRA